MDNKVNEKGERLIWLEPNVVDRLKALRGPGESYSDVILRIAEIAGLSQSFVFVACIEFVAACKCLV